GVEGSASRCLNEFFRLIDRLLAGESSQRRCLGDCPKSKDISLILKSYRSLIVGVPSVT
ncbi:unnamed protein product, partial [Musa hybrid cultivar]